MRLNALHVINEIEAQVAEYIGVKNAVALSAGTAALHLAILRREDLFIMDQIKDYPMKLLIVGAGGYGRLVKEIAELTEQFEQIDFLDDAYEGAVDKLCDLKGLQKNYDGCVVAIIQRLEKKFFLKWKER